ncbi:Fumagillin beta-trans-bergamotene synthase [Lachnellula suecica]|uniref:Fumagillin beta-trans-bergamotene synthase n=1 Tax=Lachnellula suecica TaxID=602035 RepID=A0A8T9C2P6_9HELO|nr:Fumagillin beta-trans-bergamotene synthase [Lachnellula suecica]
MLPTKEIKLGLGISFTSVQSIVPLFKISTRRPHTNALGYFLHTLWLFTVSDLKTFVVPEALFGILGALSGPLLTNNLRPSVCLIASQVPKVFLWTWLNTLVFDLSNQRHLESVAEDRLNKPFRPLAAGRITPSQTRNLLLVSVPVLLMVTYFYLGSYEETVLLISVTWMYNDLGGSDGHFVVRNLIIGIAYIIYGSGALRVASYCVLENYGLNTSGYVWSCIIGAVICTTIQVQDLKDKEGDRTRNRHTAPLALGDECARWTIAFPVAFWSVFCSLFWQLGICLSVSLISFGMVIAVRVVCLKGFSADRKTWKLWSYWLAVLYVLPVVNRYLYFEPEVAGHV